MAVYDDQEKKKKSLTPEEIADKEKGISDSYGKSGGGYRYLRDSGGDRQRDTRQQSQAAEAAEDEALDNRINDTFGRLRELDDADKKDEDTDKPAEDSLYTGTGKKKTVRARISGMSNRRKGLVFGGAAGIVGLAFAGIGIFGFLNVFKLDFFMNNINLATFSRFNASFDNRSDKWMRAYVQLRLSEIDGSTQPGDSLLFRANKVDTDSPVRDWYRTLRTSNFEADVFNKHGIRFESIAVSDGNGGVNFRPAVITLDDGTKETFTATNGLNGTSLNSSQLRDGSLDASLKDYLNGNFDTDSRSSYINVFESDKNARRSIKKAVNDETRFFQVIKRRHLRKDIANMTGVRSWRFFETTRSRIDNYKLEFQKKLMRAVIPSNGRSGQFLQCLFALGPCPASTDPNSAENRTLSEGQLQGEARAQDGSVADVDENGNIKPSVDEDGNVIPGSTTPAPNLGGEAADLVDGTVGDLASGAGEEVADLTPIGSIAKKIIEDLVGGSGGPRLVIKILDKVVAINKLFKEDANGSSKIDKLVYTARATQAMAAFATLGIMSDQIKSGEVADAAEVSQALSYMNGAENSDAWDLMNGKSSSTEATVSAASDKCKPEYEFKKGEHVPLCDSIKPNGGNKTSGIQDAWNGFISGSILGTVLDAYNAVRNSAPFHFIDNILGSVTDAIITPILKATGLDNAIGSVAAWLSETVTKWIGVLPCMDGTEETGGVAMNCILVGASASAEAATRVSGGVVSVLGSADYNYNNQVASNYLQEQESNRSFSERYLSLDNTDSLASKTAFSISNSSPGKVLGSLNIAAMIRNFSNSMGLIVGGRVSAATDLTSELGVTRYDIPQACFDLDPLASDYLVQATNADDKGILSAADLTTGVVFNSDVFWDKVYEKIGAENQAEAETIYNCAILDQRVMSGLGYTSGYKKDGGLEDNVGGGSTAAGSIDCSSVSGNEKIVCAGENYLGIRYANGDSKWDATWGTSTDNRLNGGGDAEAWLKKNNDNPQTLRDTGFLDCSGFANLSLYSAFGYKVKAGCSGQWALDANKDGISDADPNLKVVPISQAKPGDFLTISLSCDGAEPGHIGIFAGVLPNGKWSTLESSAGKNTNGEQKTGYYEKDPGGGSGEHDFKYAVRYIGPGSSP